MAGRAFSAAALRPRLLAAPRGHLASTARQPAGFASSSRQQGMSAGRFIGILAVGVVSGTAAYAYPLLTKEPPPTPQQAEIEFEKPRAKPRSGGDDRDALSAQHLQVKKSWESPGVHAWGSNAGRVAAPDSQEPVIKTPRRMPYFDGQLLRDLKMDERFGAAVMENGDLVQWGTGYSESSPSPTVTLRGKDLAKVSLSKDRIIALSSDGSVYSVPVSAADQESGVKQQTRSWLPLWSGTADISYRTLTPDRLGLGEKVVDVSSGLEHCLLLTSKGRVFSAASSSEDFPSKGQLGVPRLSWATRPKDVAYDHPHELSALRGFSIARIATGDHHSLALDKEGRVFTFGDNSTGQLGFELDPQAPCADEPAQLRFDKLYRGTGLLPRVTSVAAGGRNSFFAVDAARAVGKAAARDPASIVADTWSCGEGLYGSLGNGKWTHIACEPTKVRALSGLSEFDEERNRVMPIRLNSLSVGSTHACAVLGNAANTSASRQPSDSDTNWGLDAMWWGGNEHYQLGTGRRSNANSPTYIGPLEDRQTAGRDDTQRFQAAPRTTTRLGRGGKGRKATVEQRVECGRHVTAVYSAT